jgi:hypothetical protein
MAKMRSKSYRRIIILYYFLAALALLWILTSTYSYYAVLHTFKQTPGKHTLYELSKTLHLTIKAVPPIYGKIALAAFAFGALFFPLFIFINFVVTKHRPAVFIFKSQSIILLALYILAFVLTFSTDPFGGWYLGFILD